MTEPAGAVRIEGVDKLHGRTQIVLTFTMDDQVAIPADGIAAVFEGLPDFPQFATIR